MTHAQSAPAISPPTPPPTPWFRQPLVWLVIGIPLSSVIMGVVLITLSVTSFDGLVADDYYKRGLQINRVLDRDAAALADGLAGRLQVDAQVTRLRIDEAAAAAVKAPALTLRLSYATRAGLDRELALHRVTATDFEGPGAALEQGRWYVEVGTPRWRITGPLDVPGSAAVRLQAGP